MSDEHEIRSSLTPPPAIVIPSRPSSSGALPFFHSATDLVRLDTDYVEADRDFLKARTAQTSAMRELILARIALAKVMATLAVLPEVCAHEYERGQRERAHELRLQALAHYKRELEVQTEAAQARQRLDALSPGAASPPPLALPVQGLSPDEVEEVLQTLPEIAPETVRTITRLLAGLTVEKKA